MKDFSKFSAIIIGAGDATGAALTKKFASHGYKVCPARRPRSIEKGDMELMLETRTKSQSFLKKLRKRLHL